MLSNYFVIEINFNTLIDAIGSQFCADVALPSEKQRDVTASPFTLDGQTFLFLLHLHGASLQAHDLPCLVLIIITICLSSARVLFISPVVVVYESSCCNWEGYENSRLREPGNPMAAARFKVADAWGRGRILEDLYALEIVYLPLGLTQHPQFP